MISGKGEFLSPCVPSLVLGIRTPKLPLLPLWEKVAGGLTGAGFLGRRLRAFSCFGHQDAQTPPSPLVGEGGRGDEGQKHIRTLRSPVCPRFWQMGVLFPFSWSHPHAGNKHRVGVQPRSAATVRFQTIDAGQDDGVPQDAQSARQDASIVD